VAGKGDPAPLPPPPPLLLLLLLLVRMLLLLLLHVLQRPQGVSWPEGHPHAKGLPP
jgi:hypothetical protein